ncbi:unnamed protein product [Mesocestoides corti]|uniref:RING-type domain-containing protein n=1 Tax=Mesocestoides corti TaxID=53468 RepID=A0A0R3U4H3_MESCO|nr:unnamed protein product [Mesocestoides corti]
MTGYDICSICLSRPRNPFILSNCRHYFCGSCLQDLIALNDNLSCPNCQIRPVVIPALYTRYCMDMECPPHSDCKKLHVDSFITKKPQTTPDPPPVEDASGPAAEPVKEAPGTSAAMAQAAARPSWLVEVAEGPGRGFVVVDAGQSNWVVEVAEGPAKGLMEEVPRPTTPETWKPPPDATFCFDVFCPGGKEARCGKTHEEDFNFH